MGILLYQHYKGGIYQFLTDDILHTETGERMVLYKNSYGKMYVRPYDTFHEKVKVNGEEVPRFKYIGSFEEDELNLKRAMKGRLKMDKENTLEECKHENKEYYNHGYHCICRDCGKDLN